MKRETKHALFSLFAAAAIAPGTFAAEGGGQVLVLKDKNGAAIQGYDPVAYFTDHQPAKGSPKFKSRYDGADYYFASAEHQAMFDANPARYAPAYGGYCGYAASRDHLSPIRPGCFQILDGRLILQHNKTALRLWNQDVPGNVEKADRNWPGLVERETARQAAAASKYPLTWPGFYDYGHAAKPRGVKPMAGVGVARQQVHRPPMRLPMAGDVDWPGF